LPSFVVLSGARTPGARIQGVIESGDEAVKIAEEIGYPVMIKASAGGGGKGMRIAYGKEKQNKAWVVAAQRCFVVFHEERFEVLPATQAARELLPRYWPALC